VAHVTGFVDERDALQFEWRAHRTRGVGALNRVRSLFRIGALERSTRRAIANAERQLTVHVESPYAAL